MDAIQKVLIEAGRKDLAEEYYKKIIDKSAKSRKLETHKIEVKLVDFSADKDEPAYDVEVWIDDKPTMGGGKKQIYGIGTKIPSYQYPTKEKALKAAKDRVAEILKEYKRIGEE